MTVYNVERLNVLVADAFKELRHFPADIIICNWNMSPQDELDFVPMVRTVAAQGEPGGPIGALG